MRNTPCECLSAGWCVRHQCFKPEPVFQLCRRNQTVFRAWEDGEGPGISLPTDEIGDSPSVEMPNLFRRAANFGTAFARHAMSGFERVSDAVRNARLDTCKCCDSCDIEQMICRERSCGCYLSAKTGWASETCPRDLWPRNVDDSIEQPLSAETTIHNDQ